MVGDIGPEAGCMTDGGGVAQSTIIKSSGPVDGSRYAVFFSSENCDPDTQVAHVDENDHCVSVEYSSVAVWDLCEGGTAPCF